MEISSTCTSKCRHKVDDKRQLDRLECRITQYIYWREGEEVVPVAQIASLVSMTIQHNAPLFLFSNISGTLAKSLCKLVMCLLVYTLYE